MNALRSPNLAIVVAGLAVAYVAAGRLGLALDAVSGFATLVWAPTGLSLAALVLFGVRAWPGVAAGAFTVNLWAGASPAVALGITVGNTLEALVGTLLWVRALRPELPLSRLRDVLGLVVLAAGLATTISATVGVGSLFVGGVVESGDLARSWTAWWLGDAVGALVIAPLVLAWAKRGGEPSRARMLELLGVTATVAAASAAIFLREGSEPNIVGLLGPYLLLGPLLWATLRFETRGAAWATFVVACVAVSGTTLGLGPLRGEDLSERLWVLQAFTGLLATIFLVLGALAEGRAGAQRALRHAKDAAETSSMSKSRFLAVMSHELRTPLNAIIGYVSLLESGVTGPDDPRYRSHLARIRVAAWHLASIIEGILTFSRGEAGREQLDIRSFDAADLAREVVTILEVEASRKGLGLRSIVDPSLEIRSDPGKLRQILLNLLGNALKFSEHGEIELEVITGEEAVSFLVRDTGPGIPSDQLEEIFAPFHRLPSPAGSITEGSGLGLTVASMLSRLMGGTLTVQSEIGKGSLFTLTLPRDQGLT